MKKVIVVDDDVEVLSILDYILSAKGYEVVTSTCPEILLNLNELKPDLIILDVWLGMGDGSNMCHILKLSQLTNDIPVVLISAITGLEDIA
jgi:DNA-binding response OmpR family regulator